MMSLPVCLIDGVNKYKLLSLMKKKITVLISKNSEWNYGAKRNN